MKIGSRIALFYTIITVGAIAAVVMVFYFSPPATSTIFTTLT